MLIFGVWGDIEGFSVVDALIVALVAVLLVFLVLTIIIFVTTGIQKGMEAVEARTKILPKKENQILDEDPDAVAAALVAVIDFHKETGKMPRVKSITLWED